jgi:hypothetical protein
MQKTVTALAATAMLAFSALPALAQEAPGSPAPAPPATAPNRTATIQTVQPAGQPTYGQLISALGRTPAVTAQIRTLANLTTNNIRIVKVQSIVTPANSGQLATAVAQNQSKLAALRRTLGSMKVTATTDNSIITVGQFLSDNKMNVNNVVAADVNAGSLVLFVQ